MPITIARPCDAEGKYLRQNAPPSPQDVKSPNDWTPFNSRIEFETADLLFRRSEMSNNNVDTLLDLWAADALCTGRTPPFANHKDLHNVLDSITLGDAPWQSFEVSHNAQLPPTDVPMWMTEKFSVFHRDPLVVVKNILANPEFNGHFDYTPYRQFVNEKRRWTNLMSGNWCWKQAVYMSF
jgi:Plavaka transposase